MNLTELPKPNETWSESTLTTHQVITNYIEKMIKLLKELTSSVDKLQYQLKLKRPQANQPQMIESEGLQKQRRMAQCETF